MQDILGAGAGWLFFFAVDRFCVAADWYVSCKRRRRSMHNLIAARLLHPCKARARLLPCSSCTGTLRAIARPVPTGYAGYAGSAGNPGLWGAAMTQTHNPLINNNILDEPLYIIYFTFYSLYDIHIYMSFEITKVKTTIEKTNGQLLSVIKEKRKNTFFVKCSKGHTSHLTRTQITKIKEWCPDCQKPNKFSTSYIQNFLGKKNLTLLSVYKNYKTLINVECQKCNYQWWTRFPHIKHSKTNIICPRCRRPNTFISFEDIVNTLAQNNLSFVGGNTNKKNKLYNIKCNLCNNEQTITHRHIINVKCSNCAGLPTDETKNIVGIIYKITFPNNKVYIGQTIQDFIKRKRKHCTDSFKKHSPSYDTNVARAIRKHEIQSLKWKILHVNVPWNKLDQLEIDEIKRHGSFTDGYNSTAGGSPGAYNAHKILTRYHARLDAQKQLRLKLERETENRKIKNFGSKLKQEINKFIKDKIKTKDTELEKLKESYKRHNSGKEKYKNNTPDSSKYRGVCWDKQYKKWKTNIKVKGKKMHIGLFDDEVDAAKAYNSYALLHHGAKAKLNSII